MSNFKPWVTDGSDENKIESAADFAQSATNGFVPGTAASSKKVNSALRQANLVVCALMEMVADNTLDLTSSVADVKTALEGYFSTFNASSSPIDFTEAAQRANIVTGDTLSVMMGKISKYLSDLGDMAFKDNVGTSDFAANAKAPLAGTADSATSATSATSSEKSNKVKIFTSAPTASDVEAGYTIIYVGSTLPATRYDGVLYFITA